MELSSALPCSRCGTFFEAGALRPFRGERWCSACLPRVLREVRLWSPGLLTALGTFSPPAGFLLTMVNWWRMGEAPRMLLPVAALGARFMVTPVVGLVLQLPGDSTVLGIGTFLLLNLLAMALATIGLWERCHDHFDLGGGRASTSIAIAAAVVPVCCFMGFYSLFSGPWPAQ